MNEKIEVHTEILMAAERDRSRRIAVGVSEYTPEVAGILDAAREWVEPVVVGSDVKQFTSHPSGPEQLVALLHSGDIDGAIKGDFQSDAIIDELERQFQLRQLLRLPYLQLGDYCFFIGPDHTSGQETIRSKLELVEQSHKFLRSFNIEPTIAVLSCDQERLGEDPSVDRDILEAEYLVHHFAAQDLRISSYAGMINTAMADRNSLIVCPRWRATQFIGRTVYAAGGRFIAGPAVNGPIYVHSGRVGIPGYLSSIIFAAAMANTKDISADGPRQYT